MWSSTTAFPIASGWRIKYRPGYGCRIEPGARAKTFVAPRALSVVLSTSVSQEAFGVYSAGAHAEQLLGRRNFDLIGDSPVRVAGRRYAKQGSLFSFMRPSRFIGFSSRRSDRSRIDQFYRSIPARTGNRLPAAAPPPSRSFRRRSPCARRCSL